MSARAAWGLHTPILPKHRRVATLFWKVQYTTVPTAKYCKHVHTDGPVKLSETDFFKRCKISWFNFQPTNDGGSSFLSRKTSSSVGRRKTLNIKWVMYYNEVSPQQKLMKEGNKYYILRGAETIFKKVASRPWIFVGVCVGCPGVRSQPETGRPENLFWSSGIGVIQKEEEKNPFWASLFRFVTCSWQSSPHGKNPQRCIQGKHCAKDYYN